MAPETIPFACPACLIRLTVPGSLAGVVGPCPSCGAIIQAPGPGPARASTPLAPPIPVPGSLPADSTSSPAPASRTREPESESTPAELRPESRQLPQRARSGDLTAKQVPTSLRDPHSDATKGKRRRDLRPVRALVPLLFILAGAGAMAAVVVFLKWEPGTIAPSPDSAANPSQSVIEETAAEPPDNGNPSAATSPADSDTTPILLDSLPQISGGGGPEAPAIAALRVLERFLAATTLEERLPLMESRTPGEVLADSVIAGPLPAILNIATDIQESNAMEQLVDIYYHVDFDAGNGTADAQTILVRIRHGEEPKVVVDPFLDLYGGRLLAYANQQSERGGIFRIIAVAGAFCYEKHVPKRENKLTLRLMARDGPNEICRAYFNKLSKIGGMLKDENSGLRYGQARPCTVMLRWNVEDDPDMPYLEAIDIKSLDWNP